MRAGREADLALQESYTLRWEAYSTLSGSNGDFRLLRVVTR